MKKILVLFLCILLLGCNKNKDENKVEDKEEVFSTESSNNVLSDRRNNLDNLIKSEMIKEGYIIEKNLKSFTIDRIYFYGYYKKEPNKKDMQVNYSYECLNDKDDCVKNIGSGYSGYIIWINTDEKTIFEFKNGVSLNYNDIESGNYIRVTEDIN